MQRILWWSGIGLLALTSFIALNNTNLFTSAHTGSPVLLAHRGIAQRFDASGVKNDTCTATRILPPKHDFLENTIASMRASFASGADIVELDVHPTTDGKFAVFHDWTLDCRTDGHGVTREHSMVELKTLDIGYGYTADGGKTYPFRGKGIGLMPTLGEVLRAFPGKRFLINVKSNDATEGARLSAFLNSLDASERKALMVYGGDKPIAALRAAAPDLQLMSRSSLKACLLRYIAVGWSGMVPQACRSSVIFVPINVAPWLWGWPSRFLDRMGSVHSAVFVIGPYHGGDFSTGMDSTDDLERLPVGYTSGIMTNEIVLTAKWLQSRK
jgi:glycerophosphoryl diester phosphodiesterase